MDKAGIFNLHFPKTFVQTSDSLGSLIGCGKTNKYKTCNSSLSFLNVFLGFLVEIITISDSCTKSHAQFTQTIDLRCQSEW